MWGGLKRKLNGIKSKSIQIAVKCGFMDLKEAEQADRLVTDDSNEHPTLELLENQGYLTEKEAAEVRQIRLEECPQEAVREQFKRARRTVNRMEQTGSIRLAEVLKARGG